MNNKLEGKRIYVAGHTGMAGSSILRRLEQENCEIITATRQELDLTDQPKVNQFMLDQKPEMVVIAAARVGGIHANMTYPVNFIYDNIIIETNLIKAAHDARVEKLLFLGSSCIYPRNADQPIIENALLTGTLEPTNEWYAVAKIAGIKLCQAFRKQYGDDFISAMPTNLYGPNDNFHPENAHVPAALLQRFHKGKVDGAPSITIWGTGTPRREFLYIDDFADACVFLLKNYSGLQHINVGTGKDISIAAFAQTIKRVVGYQGEIEFDTDKPDGMPRKVLNVTFINELGWQAQHELEEGLTKFYNWFVANQDNLRQV